MTNQKVLSSEILKMTMFQFHENISSRNEKLEIEEVENTLKDIRILTDTPRFELEWCFASEKVEDISSKVFDSLQERISELALNQEVSYLTTECANLRAKFNK